MTTLSAQNPTMLDMANSLDPKGNLAPVAEILSLTNEIMDDATVIEANDGTGHQSTVRTGLPAGTWRVLYGGVPAEKGRKIPIRDSAGMLESYSKVDKAQYDMQKDPKAWRASEDMAFVEGLSQTMASTLIYGDTSVNRERFLGLQARYNSLSADNADNIIDAAGTGSDNTSIYICTWHPRAMHLFFPEGSQAGLSVKDLGEDTAQDADGNEYQVMRTHFKWDLGFAMPDWRYCVRICNIDISELTKAASAGADLVDLIAQGLELMPVMSLGRVAIYCNRKIRSFLRRQISNRSNAALTLEEAGGKKVVSYDGIPVRRVDAILNTEARIT
jgi:hypothetical protein